MSLRTYQLTLAAGQQRLSDVYGVSAKFPAGTPNPATDIPYRQVILQAETAVAYLGSDTLVAAGAYGYQLPIAGSVTLGPFDTGPIHLSDIFAAGANAILHVTGIPF